MKDPLYKTSFIIFQPYKLKINAPIYILNNYICPSIIFETIYIFAGGGSVVAYSLFMHLIMFVCGGSVLVFFMHYFVSFLVLQSSCLVALL